MRARPELPTLARLALLLDFDGTLVDIAPTPDAVVVAPNLPNLLRELAGSLGGALAIVSGRPVESVRRLLPGAGLVIVGEHGAAMQSPGTAPERLVAPPLPAEWRAELTSLVARNAGLSLEEKPYGFVLHFRRAPQLATDAEGVMRALLRGHEAAFSVQPAHMAWEIRPRGADKGSAVRLLMRRAPFSGRVPVFVGDDTTDLDGMRAARGMGGFGFAVDSTFGDARGVRGWLAELLGDAKRAERYA